MYSDSNMPLNILDCMQGWQLYAMLECNNAHLFITTYWYRYYL